MSACVIFIPVGDGTRDRGDEKRDLLFGKYIAIRRGLKKERVISVDDIVDFDAWREQAIDPGAKRAANAAMGAVAFGVAGAVIGSKMTSSVDWFGEFTLADGEKFRFRFYDESGKKAVLKWWEKIAKKREKIAKKLAKRK